LEKAEQYDFSVQANILKKQLEHVDGVGQKALNHDVNVLQTAGRDFAISLAHIYIGKVKGNFIQTNCTFVRICRTSWSLDPPIVAEV